MGATSHRNKAVCAAVVSAAITFCVTITWTYMVWYPGGPVVARESYGTAVGGSRPSFSHLPPPQQQPADVGVTIEPNESAPNDSTVGMESPQSTASMEMLAELLAEQEMEVRAGRGGATPSACLQSARPGLQLPFVDPQKVAAYRNSPDAQFDIVYTWVNGSDPRHMRAKARYSGRKAPDDRDTDHRELFYSMRSLDMYMPWWNGTLFFVHETVPCWLNVKHPRLKLVHHSQIFMWQQDTLPTFNSEAIESFLYRIPGLSERFMYLNDDIFFSQLVAPADFIVDGSVMLWEDKVLITGGIGEYNELRKAAPARRQHSKYFRSRGEVVAYYQRNKVNVKTATFRQPRHGPLMLRKSVLEQLWRMLPAALESTAKSRLRTLDDIAVMFTHNGVCMIEKQGLCTRVPMARFEQAAYYAVGGLTQPGVLSMLRRLLFAPPLFFCMNDVGAEKQQNAAGVRIEQFWAYRVALALLFPYASQWETSDCQ